MAKQDADCITLDLFASMPKAGRPRTNPLSREQQVRINKRNQLKRDRSSGLKRVELKLHSDLVLSLEKEASQLGMTRGQLIEMILNNYINSNTIDSERK
ncbi:LexA family transcriptional regulator [[Haemophilus] ducreyi]|uniref:LexA regulated protein n=1 Tax=Haemophilus ducreyi TaxID=730 RepID=UPI0006566466|nr:LexA regulated protein [[Haemophilus] ducreyi]AKO36222.1 LexA family transcriptional regulator [[Haemophilus] ducreyi]AKO37675.1 LexA family transcriptional regulator [[Haemophilus] ducreyi]AKO40721.1 LexA family transcriptional regulator [[Haemophilus] ducreyi]AKO42176.1 LexA family transcriptional regulator [[Haemophilus] ducreyi]